ncbi:MULTISPECIES: type II toxin-antitoxin system RelE/ParE family toxin [unclassified Sphingobium]|uniref:type II toxin-antitoxin system RelE/ParE family toxin n=1 Tax=unclassified Sphingobium TaxID=2611147 RepID=UPI000D156A24|nr:MULTISPECIES: type II toxin-antitoxin system RelE/ParE family toxin [unclassified Sphingobium]MBG6118509.1 proteic killer suppression protein [Sphingobium sp. JAI105]PSO11650.1 plasmid maintenance system killer protein [Sphingobium sp. AEW4]TWD07959.1 proteic killer suppression protein [Sphingobium sp. AEW010]TWD24770.1 proteic killer suppression protein [Sphingobium sp. AEW013]TWD26811.1 proteic killer suppression protein [Sphingobium sp. AEW001]
MRIEFADADLQRICTDEAHKLGLPFAVIHAARRRLVQLEAAVDERDLRNLKSLHYKKLQGCQDGRRSVRINDQYRIIFRLLENERPPTIKIVAIGDTH